MKKGDQNQSTFSPKFTADENFLSPAAVQRNSPKSGVPNFVNLLSPKIGVSFRNAIEVKLSAISERIELG